MSCRARVILLLLLLPLAMGAMVGSARVFVSVHPTHHTAR